MSSLSIGFISFACIFGGAMLGMWMRQLLPAHHLRDDSKNTIKRGAPPVPPAWPSTGDTRLR